MISSIPARPRLCKTSTTYRAAAPHAAERDSLALSCGRSAMLISAGTVWATVPAPSDGLTSRIGVLAKHLSPRVTDVGPSEGRKSMAWKYVIESHGYVYTDAAGKICGKVGEAWEGEWWAEAGNKHLGNYVDRDSAKRAVEQAFKGRY